MATKNVLLNVRNPLGGYIGDAVVFTSVDSDADVLRIPRRYPFVDIANASSLVSSGVFRHATTAVSTKLGGSIVADTEGKLGFQLPRTEKLIMLVRSVAVATHEEAGVVTEDDPTPDPVTVDGTPARSFTIKGSIDLGVSDEVVIIPADTTFVSGERIYEVDLYNFGLFIEGVAGDGGLSIVVADSALEFALIAR